MKVFITPHFDGPDTGEGGIRRVVEAQHKWLPTLGVQIVNNIEQCDIVAAHAVEPPKTNKPVVSHNHGLYWAEYEWPNWALNANKAVIESMHKADAVTTVSEWVARAIERNTWIKPTVVYHGIDPIEWPVDKAKNRSRGYVLWNKTRVDQICDPRPMQTLAQLCRDIKFVSTFGEKTDNVETTGKVSFDAAKQYILGADVYLCTSRETFGIGTLEAMAAGVPILGWAWGGQTEFIENKVDGWLARPGDFDDLERGLRYCLEHRARLGAAARKKAITKFKCVDMMKGYVDVYRDVLEREAARNNVKVSVVIPCYNLGQYMEDAVKSVAAQPALKEGDVEVIIVDDASNDGSGALCDTLAERFTGVRVIHNEENQYLAGALNTGMQAAQGKYVVPLDADNMLGPDCLAVLAETLDNDADIDIAYGSMELIEENGNRWVSSWPSAFVFSQQITHHNQIPSTAMYRRKLWERVGGYRRRCRTAEDADFWCRSTSYGANPKKVTEAVTLIYRDRHNSMSHTVADWPWEKWYPWWRDPKVAPPISPFKGPIWAYEPTKISVVIPVGPNPKHRHLVVDAVDSLMGQSFRNWEAIVVNDSGVPLDWMHPFVRVFDTGGHRGPAHARNVGFAAARGSLVLPLDADDYLQPDALEKFWNAWVELGNTKHYIYSDWIVQETGEVKHTEEYDCEEILRHLPHAVTAAYPKAAWIAVGGFDEHLNAWEDWDFVIALAAKGYCGQRLPLPLIQYRIHAGTRREELYAQRDVLIDNIHAKWSQFYEGGERLMACGGCGGRPSSNPFQGQQFSLPNHTPEAIKVTKGDLVLIEYVGRVSGPLMFRGTRTGTAYRFGLDPHHKIKYVHKDDAEALLGRNDFRTGVVATEVLQAAGV